MELPSISGGYSTADTLLDDDAIPTQDMPRMCLSRATVFLAFYSFQVIEPKRLTEATERRLKISFWRKATP